MYIQEKETESESEDRHKTIKFDQDSDTITDLSYPMEQMC